MSQGLGVPPGRKPDWRASSLASIATTGSSAPSPWDPPLRRWDPSRARPSVGGSPTTPGPEVTAPVKPFGWGLGHQLQRPRFHIGNKTADAREGTSAARGRWWWRRGKGRCPKGSWGWQESASHPAPVRAAAGRAGPFVAVRAAEPVSSRMRRGARSGGDRGTLCGELGGAARFSGAGRSSQSGWRESSPPQPWYGSAGFPRIVQGAGALGGDWPSCLELEREKRGSALRWVLLSNWWNSTPCPLSVSLFGGREWHSGLISFCLSSRRNWGLMLCLNQDCREAYMFSALSVF